jgi:hypothetical protein
MSVRERQFSASSPYDKLFNHDILMGKIKEKEFIASAIRDRYKRVPTNSKLLCRYDPLSNVNFHRYIEAVPHVLVLALAVNGNIIASFIPEPIKDKACRDSILMSVTNQ